MTTHSELPLPPLRPAEPGDVDAIAAIWHAAWSDGHAGHVPEELHPHRTLAHFLARVPSRIARTTVVVEDERVVGFVTLHDDELEQIFVARHARGGAVAGELLAEAERRLASEHAVAWLAVVAGNARARRFYEKNGWHDAGAIDYAAEIPGGSIPVPCRRYEKRFRSAPGRAPAVRIAFEALR
jgi:GNAT superfamily N-acetyltransferase